MVLTVPGKGSSEASELKEVNKYLAQSKNPISVHLPVIFLPESVLFFDYSLGIKCVS